MNLQELKEKLPFQWRVQECKEHGATCVAYIDARDVQDQLDKVVGPEKWQCDYKDVKGVVYCGIGILLSEAWVWKWDCGTESNVEKEKGEASDSFKRAAVKWGIGRFLYDMGIVKLGSKQHTNSKWYPADGNGKILWSGDEISNYINSLNGKPAPKADDGKPWLNEGTPEWEKVLVAVKDGYTITQVKTKYKLAKATEDKLKAAAAQPA